MKGPGLKIPGFPSREGQQENFKNRTDPRLGKFTSHLYMKIGEKNG